MLQRLVGMLSGGGAQPVAPAHRKSQAKSDSVTKPVTASAAAAKSTSVMRREAMLGREKRVAAYTFMLRRAPDDTRDSSLPDVRRLYDETLLGNLKHMDIARLGHRLAFVPIAPATLNHPLMDTWSNAGTVWILEGDANNPPDAALLERVTQLKAAGSRFAAYADAVISQEQQALLALLDYVLLDVSSEDMPGITSQMALLSRVSTTMRFVATGVQTLEAFHMCHKLQFALFMGPFITRREDMGSPVMGPARTKVLDLMNRVRTGTELPVLAAQFRHDPALSIRLLRYVNSPGMGLLNKVGGIDQALMVMGQDKLYRWLTLILFTGGQVQELDYAVLENALARGRMAELLAGRALFAKARDEIFVAGLFSLLDVVMHMPMQQALKEIGLPAEITEAILSQRGPYAPYLALAIACEQDDHSSIEDLAVQIGRDVEDINSVHMEALLWAQQQADV